MKTQQKGFTLIELLIVISLLGTLAVAMLAAIDPFEQFRKGTDTGVRNTSQELFNAAIRYYAQKSDWPSSWAVPTDGSPITIGQGDTASIVNPFETAGELKSNFTELADKQLDSIYIARDSGSKLLICFQPQSKSFQNADKNVKYINPTLDTSTGLPNTDTSNSCKVNSGTTDCYWCLF